MSSIVMPSFLVAFFITFSLIPLIITVVRRNNLLDEPGGRKIHTEKIPAFGGGAIFLGFISALLIWIPFIEIKMHKFLLAGVLLMVFVGIRDDLLALRPLYKLIGQIIATAIVIHWGDVHFTSFHGLFGIYEIPLWLGYLVTMLVCLTLTNAFNLIDGIDGLAGTVAMTVFIALGTFFYFSEKDFFMVVCSGMAASILAFLKFNYSPAKIFMGDTGSLLIGFLSSILLVSYFESNVLLPEDSLAKINCPLAVGLCMVAYPSVDLVRVFFLRILQKRSPFSPDQNHLHHLVLRLRLSHIKSTLLISTINACYIILAFFLRKQEDLYVLPAIIISFFLLGVALDYLISLAYPKKTKKRHKIFK